MSKMDVSKRVAGIRPDEKTANPANGAVGKKFDSKRDKGRTVEIVARDRDEKGMATWWVQSSTTGRTTRVRDDVLAHDYVPAPEVKPMPAKPAAKKPGKSTFGGVLSAAAPLSATVAKARGWDAP